MPEKNEKMVMSERNLLLFLLEEYTSLSSSNIPLWLLELNQGKVREKYFSNAKQYRYTWKAIDLLENVLTSSWLIIISGTSTGKVEFDEIDFDASRQMYIDTVRRRMDIVSMLDKVESLGETVGEFKILPVESIKVHVARTNISPLQEGISNMIEMLNNQSLDKRDLN